MKSEKEKMLAGELYDASDPLLTQERQRARMLTYQLNVMHYGDPSAYKRILASLLPNATADIWIEPPFFCDYGYNIYTGERVFFNFNCVLLDVMPIRIGSNVLFGPNVQIYTATHPIVGAGTVVTKPVPADTVVAGNPAKPIERKDG